MKDARDRGNDVAGDHAARDPELIWGEPPAAMTDEAIQHLIAR